MKNNLFTVKEEVYIDDAIVQPGEIIEIYKLPSPVFWNERKLEYRIIKSGEPRKTELASKDGLKNRVVPLKKFRTIDYKLLFFKSFLNKMIKK